MIFAQLPPIFRRDVDASGEESGSEEGTRGPFRLLSLGRVLILLEIYLLVSAHVALTTDVFLAPPVLLFMTLHDWMSMSIIVAFVCSFELFWRRTWLTGSAFVFAIVLMGVGELLLLAG